MKTAVIDIESWLGANKKSSVFAHYANSIYELESIYDKVNKENSRRFKKFQETIKTVGNFHSYNKAAFADHVVILGDNFKHMSFNLVDGTADIGAACTIKEVMNFLLINGRRLVNSGNHREQTLVGAAVTGTHGFGVDATIMDSVLVTRKTKHGVITSIVINTAPLCSYSVENSIQRMSEVDQKPDGKATAWLVFPYSDKDDPVAVVTQYEALTPVEVRPDRQRPGSTSWGCWWGLNLWWSIDGWIPSLRKVIQKCICYCHGYVKPWTMVTDPGDIDALYHPWPSVDGKHNPKFALWAYKPTHTCHNIAIFTPTDQAKEVISFIISRGIEINPDLFRCFIGVRELSTKSNYKLAGNYWGPCSAIDIYCSVEHAGDLKQLQKLVEDNFDVRLHQGKACIDE